MIAGSNSNTSHLSSPDGVTSALELLLDEIQSLSDRAQLAGADAFLKGDHKAAKSSLARSENLAAFYSKAAALRREWKKLAKPAGSPDGRRGPRRATKRMSARVEAGQLLVQFTDDAKSSWDLPEPGDKTGIRRIRDQAVDFALRHGATDPGQTNAVRKALTNAGYHLTR